ncbi:hypothetical protein CVT25_013136 [Psilocybe cyanescens]|uniref:NADH:flavin oxidoreductase/NADH oxidase N-terminal domain-containing protein n=1 Tax=Psilocybe cyanescens TaxID=93625 RepID=A0A409XK30_PSICY|nr:hypothetical protein CVT25_013136 [Psilocybe cyanescens]
MSTSALFTPIQIGTSRLEHRIVLAPLTRFRSTQKEHVPVLPIMPTYYAQRASCSGTLLITEATYISAQAGGDDNVPGIWSPEQIAAWKEVTDAVHAQKSFIYLQLWSLGRAATPSTLIEDGLDFVAPSAIPMKPSSKEIPRALTIPEIQTYLQQYATAAHNAVHLAGFDGVEVHSANGYLLDQFLQDVSNQRQDEYGGSVEGRSRFTLEAVDAVVREVGAERVGIRLSPWSAFQGMKMADPIPQFTHLVSSLIAAHPTLAYLHAIEPPHSAPPHESNDFLRKLWKSPPSSSSSTSSSTRVFISCDGYTRDTAIARADSDGDVIAFGKSFLANPDLPYRLKNNIPLNAWDKKTFYRRAHLPGTEIGYIDYPFAAAPVSSSESATHSSLPLANGGAEPVEKQESEEREKSNL